MTREVKRGVRNKIPEEIKRLLKDEIDEWIFEKFGLIPGCCSSIRELQYSVARSVAEALWPPKEGYIRKDTLFEFLDFMKDYHSGVYISADVLNAIERLKEKINSL